MALHLLRKVTPEVIAELHVPHPEPGQPAKDFLYLDKTKPWFAQGYLNDAHPRDQFSNQTIHEGTEGFAVWSDGQGVVATYASHKAAAAAIAGASITLKVDVDLETEPSSPEPSEGEPVESGAVSS